METSQINLKLSKNLLAAAQRYSKNFGYRNVQDLTAECLREKVFQENEFDETFTEDQIKLIDTLVSKIIEKKDFSTEKEMNKVLLG
ncbi:hypothetical protein CMI37_29915 [Candidatus Pacearchaeota archaeon]|nr:hypothetical protein [Candidatus Pacearchaeota archaeon]|tara:strand:- start:5175 stop:5432 length:258 start_codon:yes stop_codon:yes gene_type:complete